MTYLVDTNVWFELLLGSDRASMVRLFLRTVDANLLAVTELTLYVLATILSGLERDDVLADLIADLFQGSGVNRMRLDAADLQRIPAVRQQFGLDFDDAYQYIAARKYELVIVSFDEDFDRTDCGKKTPLEIVLSSANV